ncbi:hypothetical protein KI387_025484, partial [Taxus chinensis]
RQVKKQEEFVAKGDQAQDCHSEPCDTHLIIGRETSHLLGIRPYYLSSAFVIIVLGPASSSIT